MNFKSIFSKQQPKKVISDETVALVQNSFQKVIPIADTAVDIFYTELFALDPSLKKIFPVDQAAMNSQKNKLRDMLVAAVNGLSQIDKLVPVLQDLGKRHVGYQVKADHYDTVGTALIIALGKGLGPDFTPEVKSAWVETYTLMSNVMKKAAYA